MRRSKILLALALATAVAFVGIRMEKVPVPQYAVHVGPSSAFAQSNWSTDLGGTGAVGDMAGCVNVSADTNIVAGDLVEQDTTTVANASGRYRMGVKKLALTASSRLRCLGIAVDNIPKGRGVGRVLTRGYHPGAFVGISNASALAPIKISTTVPGSFAIGDTVAANIGYIIGRTSAAVSTGTRYKYRVMFWGAPRTAGPAL